VVLAVVFLKLSFCKAVFLAVAAVTSKITTGI